MAKHWRIHPHDPARIVALERAAAVPAVVAQLLVCRGIHDARARPRLSRRQADAACAIPSELPGAGDGGRAHHGGDRRAAGGSSSTATTTSTA